MSDRSDPHSVPDTPPASAGPEAVVDLQAIRDNTRILARRAADSEVMGVVKADGYGHGMVPAARAMLDAGVTRLGTAFVEEALELRRAGITVPIVAWILPPGARLQEALAADVELGVSSLGALAEVAVAAAAVGKQARVHLKADTGLGRGGALGGDWKALVEDAARAQAGEALRVVGLFSHFACADEPGHESIDAQLAAFHLALEVAETAGLRPEVRHMANSAATLTRPDTHFDLVRVGIAAYGLNPVPELRGTGLRPAMTLAAPVALTKCAGPGQGVSYGHRYVTRGETTLALIPLGYADGVPRQATNRGPVAISGRRFTISGTVCMDQFVVDVGDAPIGAGARALLFGPGDAGEPTAHEWAELLGTIHYEIVTRIGARVARRYVGGQASSEG